MKWGSRVNNGETRIIKKFAWFPIRIVYYWDKKTEWRWLETVKIKQEYHSFSTFASGPIQELNVYLFGGYWTNEKFVEFDVSEKREEKLKKLGI